MVWSERSLEREAKAELGVVGVAKSQAKGDKQIRGVCSALQGKLKSGYAGLG